MPAPDLQPQPEIGTTSIDSPQSWKEKLQERWALAQAKIKLMGSMVGWESIRRGMKAEDEDADRDSAANHEVIYGGHAFLPHDPDKDEDDENHPMGHMVLGDMKTEHHYHSAAKKKVSRLAKVAIAAGLLSPIVGVAVGLATPLIIDALRPEEKPPIVEPGEVIGFGVGTPYFE